MARSLRVLDHVQAPYKGLGQFDGIVVAVGRGTVDVHFLDGDFAAGVDAATVSLRTGRRAQLARARGAGPPLAQRMRVALLNAPETELRVVAYDDAYAVVSGPEGNRAYQRDMLRALRSYCVISLAGLVLSRTRWAAAREERESRLLNPPPGSTDPERCERERATY